MITERMRRLQEMQNPHLAMERLLTHRAMAEAVGKMEMLKGDTPVKGVDYFTPEEIDAIVTHIQGLIRVPRDGKDGRDGIDGITPQKGVHYRDGVDGVDGKSIKGKDGKDGVSPSIQDILAELRKDPIHYRQVEGAPDPKDLAELIAFLKRGGFRGGGSSGTVSGATAKSVDLSVQCNGSNKSFVIPAFTTAISLMGSDAPIVYRPTVDYVASGISLILGSGVNPPSAGATLIFTYV